MRLRLFLVVTSSLLLLLFGACSSPDTEPSAVELTPTPTLTPRAEPTPVPATLEPGGPVLSSALKRGCQPPGSAGFANVGLAEGATAVDFTLKDTGGNEVSLSDLLREKPVVMVFGSFT
jgi:cytochrome oxidase Cu insertion factor (SCO1/SenC/PrrC family)